MGRKKKEVIEAEQKESRIKIKGDAKRSIVAIFLFSFSILCVLGFVGEAGVLGTWIDKIVGMILGWGKWLSPVVMVASGVILLFRKETSFYISKLLGLGVAFLSVLGFFHIYFETGKLLEIAQGGEGGGCTIDKDHSLGDNWGEGCKTITSGNTYSKCSDAEDTGYTCGLSGALLDGTGGTPYQYCICISG